MSFGKELRSGKYSTNNMSYQRKQRVNYIFCLCDNIKKNDKVHFFSFFFAQMDFNHVCIFHYWRPFLLLCCSSTKPSICLNTISQLQSNYTPTIKTTSCRSTTHNLCPESGTSAKLLFCFFALPPQTLQCWVCILYFKLALKMWFRFKFEI